MKIGEKIKQLRQSRNMTQPALADALEIEQSYLSKLENGKATPSSDIFEQILKVFDVTAEDFLRDLSTRHIKQDLHQITALQQAVGHQQSLRIANRQRLLVIAGCCFSLGVALMSLGFINAFSTTYYTYESEGVVRPGESKEVFNNWSQGIKPDNLFNKKVEMYQRKNEVIETHKEFKGDIYFIDVEGGSRTFRLENRKVIYFTHWNNTAKVLGIVLFSLCFFLLYVERRSAKI